MSVSRIALVYCQDNQSVAQEIEQALSGVASFDHFTAQDQPGSPALSQQLADYHQPVLLLVSDNFLQATNCMYQAIRLLQQDRPILPIVIDGVRDDVTTGQRVRVETNVDKVSDIIQYINHWQDRYLDLRKQRRDLSEAAGERFDQYLRTVREVSSEVGEFLRMLRATWHLTLHEFQSDNYHQFFIFIDDEEAWLRYKQTAPQPQSAYRTTEETAPPLVDDIPGMDQLRERPQPTRMEETSPVDDLTQYSEVEGLAQIPAAELHLQDNGLDEPVREASTDAMPDYQQPRQDEIDSQIQLWIRNAWSMADNDQASDGVTLLETALENYPSRTDLRYHYALMMAQATDDFTTAREQLELILQIDPDHQDANFLLGELADATGDANRARYYFEHVADLNDEYPEVWYRLGSLSAQDPAADRKDTARYFRWAVKHDPANADLRYHYAQLLNDKLHKPQKAVKQLQKILTTDPQHADAHLMLAQIYQRSGDYVAALAAYQSAVTLDSSLRDDEFGATLQPPAAEILTPQPAMRDTSPEPANGTDDPLAALKQNVTRLENILQKREQDAVRAREIELLQLRNEEMHRLEADITARVRASLEDEQRAKRPGVGKTVLISGATSGIGRATAARFAQEGYRIIVTGRREDRLEELEQQLSNEHATQVHFLPFDVRDQASTQQMIDALPDEWRQIDILINNAGKAKGLAPIHEGDLAHWDEMIDTNIKGLLYLTRAVTPAMVARGSGQIINICSTAGKEVYPSGNVYCATKHAVDALTRAMRLDLHQHGVRVGQICPAHVEETEFALVRFDGDAERAAIYEDFKPLSAADVADAIYYMVSQPAHVNVLDMVIQSTQQASSTVIDRSGRAQYEEE